jgi:hypothetical protein
MRIFKLSVYLFLTFILITNGCLCENEDVDADDGLEWKPCVNIDPVAREFTFDVYAKYRALDEPMQSEGMVTVKVEMEDYMLKEEKDGKCKYEYESTNYYFTENFNNVGKALVKTSAFTFDNENDRLNFAITVHLSSSTDVDQFANTRYGSAKYNSENSYVLVFSYISEYDL